MKRSNSFVAVLLALTAFGGTAALAETGGAENPMAEAKALLASPTSLTQAIVTLASNDTQDGENGDGAEDGEGGADGEQDGENANS